MKRTFFVLIPLIISINMLSAQGGMGVSSPSAMCNAENLGPNGQDRADKKKGEKGICPKHALSKL